MENTEKLIVEQLKNGNEDAYKYIYDYHYVLLCHVANQYLNDNFLSETIVGDVIFHLWEIRETLNITISIRGNSNQARNHHAGTPAIRCGLQGTFRY